MTDTQKGAYPIFFLLGHNSIPIFAFAVCQVNMSNDLVFPERRHSGTEKVSLADFTLVGSRSRELLAEHRKCFDWEMNTMLKSQVTKKPKFQPAIS